MSYFTNRLWSRSCGCNNGCEVSCCNSGAAIATNGFVTSVSTLLDTLDTSIQTCAEAMNYYAEQFQRRVGGKAATVTSSSETNFTWFVQLRGIPVSVALTTTGGCRYPVDITYTYGSKTNTSSFRTMDAVIDWLVVELR